MEWGSDHTNMLNTKLLHKFYGLIMVLEAFFGVKKRF